jgi:uncharacterized protein (DUF2235 family)
MTRNLVLCADGTCNAFGHSSSNVARLLEHIELQNRDAQVVIYDQGIGTRLSEHKEIARFRDQLGKSGALHLLDPPKDAWTRPWTWRSLFKSMTEGFGLDTNVAQLYEAVATLYRPGDRVFLFGFSRGAFTVRALAALTWRYGLPASNDPIAAKARFVEAWPLFVKEFPDEDGSNAERAFRFREGYHQRECPIHFLGLWDTVKSYGGLKPVMLPHLRHNPSVDTVRHALSLDERRAWFEVTTWGWLDLDREDGAAASRLSASDKEKIGKQDVLEVWFAGCHADIGGGRRREHSSEIAARWMLGEAHRAHLRLNSEGCGFLAGTDERPTIKQSRTLFWKAVEQKQRSTIRNDGRWPRLVDASRGASPREPSKSVRAGIIWHHDSVTDLSRFGTLPENVTLRPRSTLRTPDAVVVG